MQNLRRITCYSGNQDVIELKKKVLSGEEKCFKTNVLIKSFVGWNCFPKFDTHAYFLINQFITSFPYYLFSLYPKPEEKQLFFLFT